jgi:hypothetical protein
MQVFLGRSKCKDYLSYPVDAAKHHPMYQTFPFIQKELQQKQGLEVCDMIKITH